MNHCKNYVCSLEQGCYCRCESCASFDAKTELEVLKAELERVKQQLAIQYYWCNKCFQNHPAGYVCLTQYTYPNNMWYCAACQQYHQYGYVCVRFGSPTWTTNTWGGAVGYSSTQLDVMSRGGQQ